MMYSLIFYKKNNAFEFWKYGYGGQRILKSFTSYLKHNTTQHHTATQSDHNTQLDRFWNSSKQNTTQHSQVIPSNKWILVTSNTHTHTHHTTFRVSEWEAYFIISLLIFFHFVCFLFEFYFYLTSLYFHTSRHPPFFCPILSYWIVAH